MEREYYDLREIILGLQSQYQDNVGQLKELKNYVRIIDRRVSDLEFWMRHENNGTTREEMKLLCTFTERKNRLQQRLDSISLKIGTYIQGKEISEVCKNMGKHYKISGYYNAMIIDEKGFAEQVDKIMHSSFVKNIPLTIHKIQKEGETSTIELDVDSIDFSKSQNDRIGSAITYYGSEDRLYYNIFNGDNKRNGQEKAILLQDALYNTKFPKSHFSPYHQALIDESENSKREIIIEANTENQYRIDNNNEGAVVLRKVKK